MSVGLIMILLNELNKSLSCESLASIIFNSMSSINLVMNLHEFDILFITHPPPPPKKNQTINCYKDHFSPTCLLCNTSVSCNFEALFV